jgi:hypothetical protein
MWTQLQGQRKYQVDPHPSSCWLTAAAVRAGIADPKASPSRLSRQEVVLQPLARHCHCLLSRCLGLCLRQWQQRQWREAVDGGPSAPTSSLHPAQKLFKLSQFRGQWWLQLRRAIEFFVIFLLLFRGSATKHSYRKACLHCAQLSSHPLSSSLYLAATGTAAGSSWSWIGS